MRRVMQGCLLVVVMPMLSVLFTLAMVELGARVYMRVNQLYIDPWAFRAAQPPPYQDAPYFSADFIHESFTQPGRWLYPEGTHQVLPDNYEGTDFHVRDYRRVTTDQPATFDHTLYVFGGSTVYASEVPDAYTIPSQLQRLLNDALPGVYRVENMGVTSVNSTQEVERLLTVDLHPGDVVVFYHGVNDAVQALYYRGANGTMADTIRQKHDALSEAERLRFNVYQWLAPSSSAVALLLYPYSTVTPDWLTDPALMDIYRADLAEVYGDNLATAQLYANTAGATVVTLLQPNLFTQADPTAYEVGLQANVYLVPPGIETALEQGYSVLRDMTMVDVSDAFAGHSGEIFLDYVHVNHEGNRLAAQAIYEGIDHDIE